MGDDCQHSTATNGVRHGHPPLSQSIALGGLLASRGEGEHLVIEQGIEMGRPSRIEVFARGMAVTIAGPCVPMFEGTLTL